MPQALARIAATALLALAAAWSNAQTGDWGDVTIVSGTVGNNQNRLCMGVPDHMRPADIGCPSYAPSLSTAGHVSITGNVSANKFIGDGAGLTNLDVQGDRIVSNTHAAIVNENTGYISLTTAGGTWGYVSAGWSYLANLFTNTVSSSLVSATNVSATYVDTTRNGTVSGTYGYFRYISGTDIYGRFTGDGTGLTGVTAAASDRIISGTNAATRMVAISDTGYISITQAGANSGWFDPYRGLVTLGVSATGSVSGTAGYFAGGVAIGKTGRLATLDVAGTISASDAIQVGSSSLSCGAGIPGAIRFNSGNLQYCNGVSWVTLSGGGIADWYSISNIPAQVVAVSDGTVIAMQTVSASVLNAYYVSGTQGYFPAATISALSAGSVGANSVSSSLVSATNVSASFVDATRNGTVSATYGYFRYISGTDIYGRFTGDGSGLTGVTAAASDRIISGTNAATRMVAISETGYISITQAGANSGWFDPYRGLVTLGVSATGPISGTHGYFSGNVGIGTSLPTQKLDVVDGVLQVSRSEATGQPIFVNYAARNSALVLRYLSEAHAGLPADLWQFRSSGVARNIAFTTFDQTPVLFVGTGITGGRVGIGSQSPTATLQISGSLIVSTTAQTTTPSLFVGANGSVGFGTSTPGGAGMAKLEISGPDSSVSGPHLQTTTSADNYPLFQLMSWAHNNINIVFDAAFDGTNWKSSHDGSNFRIRKVNNALVFDVNSGTTAGTNIPAWTTGLTIRSNNNIAIGAILPAVSLTVVGEVQVSNSGVACAANTRGAIRYTQSGAALSFCNGSTWTSIGTGTGQEDRIVSGTTNAIAWQDGSLTITTNNVQRMIVGENGNVGIGMATPSVALEVSGSIRLTPNGAANRNISFGASYGSAAIHLYDGGSAGTRWGWGLNAGEMQFFSTNAVGNRFTWNAGGDLQSSGNSELMRLRQGTSGGGAQLGIGTAAPTANLQVSGSFMVSGSNDVAGAPDFYVDPAGRVGVNKSAPLASLDVVGTISTTDAIQLGQNTIACGTQVSGSIRYNIVSNTVQFCNGSGWVSLASGTTGGSALGDRIVSGTTNAIAWQDRSLTISTNNQERIIVGENGNVGIGTSMPAAALQVNGGFIVSTSGQDTTPSMYVTTGRVGIGTNNPQERLHVGNIAGGRVFIGEDDASTRRGLLIAATTANEVSGSTYPPYVRLAAHDYAAARSIPLVINPHGSQGFVSIGKFDPKAMLDVQGTISASNAIQVGQSSLVCSSSISGSIRYSTTSDTLQVCTGSGWKSLVSGTTGGGGTVTGTGSATAVAFWSGANALSYSDGFYWDNTNKRLGIGTNVPAQPLWVSVTTTDSMPTFENTSGTGRMLVRAMSNAGNITLRAYGSAYSETLFDNPMARSMSLIGVTSNSAPMIIGSYFDGPLVFGVSNSEDMRITPVGNVGIGTKSPTATLQVSGTFTVSTSAQNTLPSLHVDVNGRVGMGANQSRQSLLTVGPNTLVDAPATSLMVKESSSSIANTADSYVYPAEVQYQTSGGNTARLLVSGYRRDAGTLWTGTGYRLQYAVDNSFMAGGRAHLELGAGLSGDGRIVLGVNGSDRLIITTNTIVASGTVSLTNALQLGQITIACASGVSGSIRYNTTSNTVQFCNGTGWVSLASGTTSGGTLTGTGSATAVAFWSGSNALSFDSGLYWDNANKRLGVGITTPARRLDVAQVADDVNNGIGVFNAAQTSRLNFWAKGLTGHIWSGGSGQSPLVINAGGGFVGIGTESPTVALHVSGSLIVSSTQTNLSPSLFVGTDGRVGLGTASIPTSGTLFVITPNYGQYGPAITIAESAASVRKNLKFGISATASANGSGFIQYTQENVGHSNLLLNPIGGNVGVGTNDAKAMLDVAGTISASNAIQLGQNTIACATGVSGSIRYNTTSNTIQFCNGSAWTSLASGTTGGGGTAEGDRITSGTLAMVANSATSYVSLSTAGTTWGYLNSGNSFLPTVSANRVSSTNISASIIQVGNTGASCTSGISGSIRYSTISSTIEYCNSAAWVSMGPSDTVPVSFYATRGGSNQTVTSAAATKIQFNTEVYDTNNNFDNSTNYRFQPTVKGRYLIVLSTFCPVVNAGFCIAYVYKNGAAVAHGRDYQSPARDRIANVIYVADMNGSTDYIEGYVYTDQTTLSGDPTGTYMQGILITGGVASGGGGGSGVSALASLTDVSIGGASTGQVLSYNGSVWVASSTTGGGSALGDRLTSGTLPHAVTVNSATGIISLSTSTTDWGYLSSGASYIPNLRSNHVSTTNVSATHLQLNSPTTVLACNAGLTGTMRYTSGTMQVCDGSNWGNIGIGVPTGTITAFAASSCPSGWSEYTASRGRFLRGIDNGAGIDPSGTRAPGNQQSDAMQQITGTADALIAGSAATASGAFSKDAGTTGVAGSSGGNRATWTFNSANSSGARTATETRPSNVAVTFCVYSGFQSAPGQTILTTLASLTDVSVGGASNGQVLTFSGGTWIASNTAGGGGNALGDRIISGTTSAIAYENQSLTISTAGTQRIIVGADGKVGIGTTTPTLGLDVYGHFIARTASGLQAIQTAGVGNARVMLGSATVDDTVTTVQIAYGGNGLTNNVLNVMNSSSVSLFRVLHNGNVGIGVVTPSVPTATLDVRGTISATDAIQVGSSSLACNGNIPGAIRYNAGSLQLCNGASWNTLAGGGAADRITAGTVSVTVNGNGYVSLTTGVTDWGYLSSGVSFLPSLAANKISSTNVSATYIQLNSPTTVLACNSGLTGSMRYTSGTMQVCDGANWGNIGLGVPTGTIAAFAASSCPSGWNEYTASRGRFLRGIDNGAGVDPAGNRAGGNLQDDAMQRITGSMGRVMHANDANTGAFTQNNLVSNNLGGGTARNHVLIDFDSANSPGARTATETRPSNVAVTFCVYAGFQSAPGQTIITQLSSMTDVSVGGAQSGQLLSYNGSSWVPVNPLAGDRITSGTSSVIANQNQSITFNTGGIERMSIGANGNVAIGLSPTSAVFTVGAYEAQGLFQVRSHNATQQQTFSVNTSVTTGYVHIDVGGSGHSNDRFHFGDLVTTGNHITTMGRIGIGMAETPSASLHVVGTVSVTDAIQIGVSSLTCSAGLSGAIRYNGGNIQFCNGASWTTLSASGGDNLGNHTAVQNLAMQSYSVVGTGQVSMTNVSATTLEVGGNITYYGVLTDASDYRFKTDIKAIASSLEELLKLQPVSFRMKGDDRTELGFVAQDVEKVFPELVFTQGPNGMKTLNYVGLIAPIVKAVQELKAANDNLRNDLRRVEGELKAANDNDRTLRTEVDELRRELRELKQAVKR